MFVVTSIATILAIVSVAIIVSILFLRHVDTIKRNAHILELAACSQTVDEFKALFCCIVFAADVDSKIRDTANLQCIGNKTNRSCIDDDIIIHFLQMLRYLIKRVACD